MAFGGNREDCAAARFVTTIFTVETWSQFKKTCHKPDAYPVLASTETGTDGKAIAGKKKKEKAI